MGTSSNPPLLTQEPSPFADDAREALAMSRTPSPFADDAREALDFERQKASGLEWWGVGALNLAKKIADGTANIAYLALGRNVDPTSGALDLFLTPKGDDSKEAYERFLNSEPPGPSSGDEPVVAAGPRGADDAFNQWVGRKLGRDRIYTDAAGWMLSYVFSPGAQVAAKGGAAAVRPLANVMERSLAKAVAKGTHTAEDAVQMVRDGRFWSELAKNPEWKKSAGIWKATLGRNTQELMGATGANIAQSYALSPDDERLTAAGMAVALTPFMVPITKIGQRIAGLVARGALDDATANSLRGIASQMERGEITAPAGYAAMQKLVGSNVGTTRMAVANGVASLFEGGAFMSFSPQTWSDLKDWHAGDTEAGARLFAAYLGTAAGVLGTKYAMPQDLLPIFKQVRPDLNNLDLHLEAEANKRAAAEKAAQAQEPGAQVVDRVVERIVDKATADPVMAARKRDRVPNEVLENVELAKLQEKFGWAQQPTLAALRSGFEPRFDHETGAVDLHFGADHSVRIAADGDGFRLSLPENVRAALRDADRAAPDGDLTGDAAKRAFDDVALLALHRRLQGDLLFGRLGMDEVADGLWRDSESGRYFAMQLDGSQAWKEFPGSEWAGREDFAATGGFGEPVFEHPSLDQWSQWVAQKAALAPDPLVDQVLQQALLVAAYGKGDGAEHIRAFFENTTPDAIAHLAKPDLDEFLALQLGSLASGQSNTPQVLREVAFTREPTEAHVKETAEDLSQEPRPGGHEHSPGQRPESHPADAEAIAAAAPKPSLSERMAGEAGFLGSGRELRPGDETPSALEQGFDWYYERLPVAIGKSGAKDFAGKMREAGSRARTLYGEAMPEAKAVEQQLRGPSKAAASEFVPVEGAPNWKLTKMRALVERRAPAKDANDTGLLEKANKWLARLWNQGVAAKTVRYEGDEPRLITEREGGAIPRIGGKDAQTVFGSKELRNAFFTEVVERNPDLRSRTVFDPATKQRRQFTADDLAEAFLGEPKAGEGRGVEREAQFEMVRTIRNWPDVWNYRGKDYEITETNPFELLRRVTEQQTRRTATIETFGQDLPENVRQQFGIEREGLSAEVARAKGAVRAGRRQKTYQERIDTAARYLQGLEGQPPGAVVRALSPFESFARGAATVFTFALDLADPAFTLPTTAGWARTAKAYARMYGGKDGWKSPVQARNEAVQLAEREGAIIHEIGERVAGEASTVAGKLADIVSTPGRITERGKAALANTTADVMIESWAEGKFPRTADTMLLRALDFTPEQTAKLLTNTADKKLVQQFKHEYVQLVTGQRRPGEGSLAHGSRTTNFLLRFQRFWIGRHLMIAKGLREGARAFSSEGTWAERSVAAQRSLAALTGIAFSGLVGTAVSYAIFDAFKGENGFKRFWQEMSQMPSALWKAAVSPVFGGPAAQITRAATEPDNVRAFASMTAPTAMANAFFEAVKQWRNPAEAAWTLAKRLPLIPAGSHVENAVVAVSALLQGRQNLDAHRSTLNRWKRQRGIPPDPAPAGDKPQAWYDATGAMKAALMEHVGDAKGALAATRTALQEALGVADGAGVAQSIRNSKFFDGLDPEQRKDFQEYVDDDERIAAMYAYDRTVEEFATLIQREQSTAPASDFETSLRAVLSQAKLGATDVFGKIVDDTLDRATAGVLAGQGISSDVGRLAAELGAFPQQLDKILSDRQAKAIRRMQPAQAGRFLEGVLKARVVERVKSEAKERAKARRGQ